MEEAKKVQIISAIYLAINNCNYRCACTIFDEITMKIVNDTQDEVLELVECYKFTQLTDSIKALKHDI